MCVRLSSQLARTGLGLVLTFLNYLQVGPIGVYGSHHQLDVRPSRPSRSRGKCGADLPALLLAQCVFSDANGNPLQPGRTSISLRRRAEPRMRSNKPLGADSDPRPASHSPHPRLLRRPRQEPGRHLDQRRRRDRLHEAGRQEELLLDRVGQGLADLARRVQGVQEEAPQVRPLSLSRSPTCSLSSMS